MSAAGWWASVWDAALLILAGITTGAIVVAVVAAVAAVGVGIVLAFTIVLDRLGVIDL